MKLALVFSKTDPASRSMRWALGELMPAEGSIGGFTLVVAELDKELVYTERGELPEADCYVFLSRHVGGRSCFTLHSTGNPGVEAKLGGSPRTLGVAAPILSHTLLKALTLSSPLPVVYEATHHGPTDLDRPSIFLEIGVSESDWTNPTYALYVMGSLKRALGEYDTHEDRVACCFGGPHYASVFTEHALTGGYCLGHIISKHHLEAGDTWLVEAAVRRSEPQPTYALIDWDGLRSEQRKTVMEGVKELGLKLVKL
ncbi:MAG: D-aminoacyl-tRNA deacylase [Thermoprotei archaeon]